MTTVNSIDTKIEEYSEKYRNPKLPKIQKGEIYNLKKDIEGTEEIGWPDSWPNAERNGVYAIINKDTVLYVGKASLSSLGSRLSSYFRYGKNRRCEIPSEHTWSSPPTHVCTWAVPEDMSFEASALEEYLIRELDLPDNISGNR